MKPIKFLLSLCAVLMVALASWAQGVTTISAPTFTVAPSSPLCVGSTFTTQTPTVVESGCSANALILEILDQATNLPISTFGPYAAAVGTPANAGGQNITIPAAAAGKTVYFRYKVDATGACAATGTVGSTFTVASVVDPGTITFVKSTLCQGEPLQQASTTCAGTVKLYTTATGSTTTVLPGATPDAGTFTLYVACVAASGCESTRTPVSYTVNAAPGDPSGTTLTSASGCVGTLPTLSGNPCGSNTAVMYNTSGAIFGAADVATAGAKTVVVKCQSAAGCISANAQNAIYTVNAFPTLTNAVVTTNVPTGGSTICKSLITASTTLNFGGTCSGTIKVYAAETGGTALAFPISAPSSTTDYYLTCESAGCESTTRSKVTLTVTEVAAGTITFVKSTLCQGEPLQQASTTCAGTVKLYTDATGSTTTVLPGTTPNAGTFTLYVACVDAGGCESTRTPVSYTVNALPGDPSGTTLTSASGCVGTLPTLSGNPCGSNTAVMYNTSGAIFGAADVATAGAKTVVVKCQSAAGCISANAQNAIYTVNAFPTLTNAVVTTNVPTGGSTICKSLITASTTLNFGGTCSGTIKVYAAETGGTALAFPISAPSSTTDYYLTCESAGCESTTRSKVTLTVTEVAAGTITFVKSTLCQGEPLQQASTTCAGTVKLYTDATGSTTTVLPGTTPNAGTFTLYVACVDAGGCESTRTPVSYTVNALPGDPSGTTLTSASGCVGTLPTLSGNPCGSNTAVMYNTSGAIFGAADVATAGAKTVVVKCQSAAGCISANAQNAIYTVNAFPTLTNAVVTTNVPTGGSTICKSLITASTTLNFGGTCSGTIKVYAAETGGTALAFPISAPSSTTDYYLTCESAGCESTTRSKVTLTVTEVAAGTITFVKSTLCQGEPLQQASTTCASGTTVKLYTASTGSTTTVLPGSTPNAGTFTLYVACVDAGGCESTRTPVSYTVNATPSSAASISGPSGTQCAGMFSLTASCAPADSVKVYEGSTLLGSALGSGTFNVTKTPSGSSNVTYTFTAKCTTTNGCEGAPSTTTVVVRPTLATPVAAIIDAESKTSRCQGQATIALYFNSNCGTLATVWYSVATGGTAIATLPNTTPTTVQTYEYYAACKDLSSGCESPVRAKVTYTVNPAPSNPTAPTLTVAGIPTVIANQTGSVCSASPVTITFGGCAPGETLWYSVGGGNYVAGSSTTQAPDSNPSLPSVAKNYKIKCQLGDCVSQESATMSLKVSLSPVGKPTATLTPGTVCATAPASTPFGGSSSCGSFATVWFDASGDVQLLSLPATIPATAKTYYAKCQSADGCLGEKSDNVTFNIIPNATKPTITSVGGTEVCTGVNVTLTTNCPTGSTVMWSTGATGNALPLVSNVPQVRAVTAKCVTTVGNTTCESPVSETTTVVWKTFDITIINIGSPLSGVKPGSNVPKSAWAANFVTVDAGPSLQSSSQGNPSVFFTENPNKGADRFWTVHVESCALGTAGAISYDMSVTPEAGVPYSYNTVENNAPYLMYANRDGFTELYAHNHGAYGFTSEPKYAQGLPKGLYKLSIRYWSEKGMGLYPSVRTAQGTQLAYQEYWFRIQSQNGIGSGAAREGVTENTEAPFVTMGQNPVTRTLSLTINGAKGQDVKLNLVDASGRSIKVSSVTPETNTHREEIDMTSQNTGMYFIQVSTPSKRAALKVLKVSQD